MNHSWAPNVLRNMVIRHIVNDTSFDLVPGIRSIGTLIPRAERRSCIRQAYEDSPNYYPNN